MFNKGKCIIIILSAGVFLILGTVLNNMFLVLLALLLAIVSEKKSYVILFKKQDEEWDAKRQAYKNRVIGKKKSIVLNNPIHFLQYGFLYWKHRLL